MTEVDSPHRPDPGVFTWWIFGAFGLLFIAYGIYAFTLPYFQPNHWNDLTSSEETVRYIADNFRWLGMLSTMFGLLTVSISYGAFRRGLRWAWFAFLSFPVFFLLATIYTWPGLLWSPFLLASLAGLVVAYPSIFRRS